MTSHRHGKPNQGSSGRSRTPTSRVDHSRGNGRGNNVAKKPISKRSPHQRSKFLKNLGIKRLGKGYNVDHIVPLFAGGKDRPSNMQILSVYAHKIKNRLDKLKYGKAMSRGQNTL